MAKDLANAIANHMLRNNRRLGLIEEVGQKKELRYSTWVVNLPQAIQDALDAMSVIDVTTQQDQERQFRNVFNLDNLPLPLNPQDWGFDASKIVSSRLCENDDKPNSVVCVYDHVFEPLDCPLCAAESEADKGIVKAIYISGPKDLWYILSDGEEAEGQAIPNQSGAEETNC